MSPTKPADHDGKGFSATPAAVIRLRRTDRITIGIMLAPISCFTAWSLRRDNANVPTTIPASAQGASCRIFFQSASRRYVRTARTSAQISTKSTIPTDSRAGRKKAKRGTARMPSPGIPVLDIPAIKAPANAKAQCHHGDVNVITASAYAGSTGRK